MVVVSYNAAAIFDVCISVITDPLTYLQIQSTEARLPIKECSQRKCAPCGCDGEWRSATLVRCRSASAHRHVEGQTSNRRIHTSPHCPCANRAKSRWAASPSNGLPAINNPSFHHTADETKFGALIHVPLRAFSARNPELQPPIYASNSYREVALGRTQRNSSSHKASVQRFL